MAQKFDIGLNAKINEFTKKFNITRTEVNDNDVFEDFGNYIIASNFLEEELDNVKSVSTNKAQGIDGIVIIVNNRLVSEESDLGMFGPTETIKIKIGFIQSTTKNSFDEQKFSAFTDEVEIVAKIISTNDNNLKKMIIYSANNQNSIDRDLQSLNEFHEKIETYFLGKEESNFHLHFERLRGQHSNVTPPYSKVNIETLARVFISVFLKKPHEMKSNAISVIEKFQKEGKIFNSSNHEASQYYYCCVLWYWFNHLLVNGHFTMNSKTMDMHILTACDILLEHKNCQSVDEKINYLSDSANATSVFTETVMLLNGKDYLFERRGFYSNPKTEKLIQEINGTNSTTNTTS